MSGSHAEILVVSNRGPLTFRLEDGAPVARRGAGGLVSGVGPIVEQVGAEWVAAAMTDGDRVVARSGTRVEAEGQSVRLLDIDPGTYRAAYDVVCNATLWYAHHALWDLARRPRFDRRWLEAWEAYREVNAAFARTLAETAPTGAVVLVQDYHLALVGGLLATDRPDLSTVHFSHTPFASPEVLSVLPDAPRQEMLAGMAGHTACGFHTQRWSDRFAACLAADGVPAPRTFVSPLASDPDDLRGAAGSPACAEALARLEAAVGDRAVIARVDRIELSKNIVRGFLAYELLLEEHPHLHDRVVFAASIYPSREGLPDYLAYRQEVESVVGRVNERFATGTWTPILLDAGDDFPASVALLRRYDVLLVNPILDGLNLVAREGPLVNERDGVVCLSPGAGVWDELGDLALRVHPYDVAGTADGLATALGLAAPVRSTRSAALRARVEARVPADWWRENLAAASSAAP